MNHLRRISAVKLRDVIKSKKPAQSVILQLDKQEVNPNV